MLNKVNLLFALRCDSDSAYRDICTFTQNAVEDILERLSVLESGSGVAKIAPATTPVAPVPEKKTLIPETVTPPVEKIEAQAKQAEPQPEAEPDDGPPERDFSLNEPPEDLSFYDVPLDLPIDPPVEITKVPKRINIAIPMTVRLASLSSEELEHAKDEKLDDRYDEQLELSGDNLTPIAAAKDLVGQILGIVEQLPIMPPNGRSQTAAATAPTRDMSHLIPEIGRKEAPLPMPVLAADPTPDDLLAFANAHPTVHFAKKIFRATVVEAKRT